MFRIVCQRSKESSPTKFAFAAPEPEHPMWRRSLTGGLGWFATALLGCSAAAGDQTPTRADSVGAASAIHPMTTISKQPPTQNDAGGPSSTSGMDLLSATLLIVTDDAMTSALLPLVAHKNATHMPTAVVTSDMLKSELSGAWCTAPELAQRCAALSKMDEATVIKAGIEYNFSHGNLRYVFLAGDETHVPTRYTGLWSAPSNPTTIGYRPTDFYYEDLYEASGSSSFSTWDANNNGIYNESAWAYSAYAFNPDKVYAYPQLAVGRLDVNDASSLSNYVSKVIAYETLPAAYSSNATFIEDEAYGTADSDALEIAGDFAVSGTKYYGTTNHDPTTMLSSPWSAVVPSDLALAANYSGWIVYVGHGAPWGWDPGNTWDSLFDKMLQPNMPVVIGIGCQTGLFTKYAPDNVGPQPLGTPAPTPAAAPWYTYSNHVLASQPMGGGIAYMGETLILPDDKGTEFVDDLAKCYSRDRLAAASGGMTLGDVWLCAQRAYWSAEYLSWTNPSAPGTLEPRIYLSVETLFGDPSLRLQAHSPGPSPSLPFGVAAGEVVSTPAPVVTGIQPASGPLVGGTVVQIDGTGFGTQGRTQISFDGVAAIDVLCSSTTTCFATAPAGTSANTPVPVTAIVDGFSSPATTDALFSYACNTAADICGPSGGCGMIGNGCGNFIACPGSCKAPEVCVANTCEVLPPCHLGCASGYVCQVAPSGVGTCVVNHRCQPGFHFCNGTCVAGTGVCP